MARQDLTLLEKFTKVNS